MKGSIRFALVFAATALGVGIFATSNGFPSKNCEDCKGTAKTAKADSVLVAHQKLHSKAPAPLSASAEQGTDPLSSSEWADFLSCTIPRDQSNRFSSFPGSNKQAFHRMFNGSDNNGSNGSISADSSGASSLRLAAASPGSLARGEKSRHTAAFDPISDDEGMPFPNFNNHIKVDNGPSARLRGRVTAPEQKSEEIVARVPEPDSLVLMCVGFAGLLLTYRRRSSARL